jgi:DNA-binding XRE family transcriptional regulator
VDNILEVLMKLVGVRRSRLMSTRELSRQANVARKTINDIELGRVTPALFTIRKLCEALNVDPMEVDEFRDAIGEKNWP